VDDNLAIFLILALSIVGAVTLTALIAWMRTNARVRIASAAEGSAFQPRVEQLTGENASLRDEVAHLHERLAVLERIATDPAERTAREIESLR